MLVSSTESPFARALGVSSQKPEQYGVDFMWASRGKWWGCQRKALSDFVASVDDGRLGLERMQMASLHHAWLLLETGERGGAAPREMPNLTLAGLGSFGRAWTGPQLRGCLYSLMLDGIHVICVRDEAETLDRVLELEAWSKKPDHQSARSRGSCPTDVFGKRDNRQYACWLLMSLPGVGAKMAGAIFDHFGGLPIGLREGVGVKELMAVEGVGKVTAQRMVDVLGWSDRVET